MHKLYTVGYAGLRDPAELGALAWDWKADVVDIRFQRVSRSDCWRPWGIRPVLQKMGVVYWTCEALGNVNYKERGRPIELRDWLSGQIALGEALELKAQVLLCACKEWRGCHRELVATRMATEFGVQVVHWEREAPVDVEQLELF